MAWLFGALVAAAIRSAVSLSSIGRLDSDEAVTGIMALRILQGDHYIYFAGQEYMGTIEQYLQAAVFAVLPPNPWTLRIPQIAIAALTTIAVGVLAWRVYGRTMPSAVAALSYAFGPFFNLLWGIKSHGAYSSATLVATIGFVSAIGFARAGSSTTKNAMVFGFSAGMILWLHWSAFLLLVPTALWLVPYALHDENRWRWLAAMAVSATAASAPVWLRFIATGQLPGPSPQPVTTVAERSDVLFNALLPYFLGFRVGPEADLFPWAPASLLVALVIAAFGVALYRNRAGIVEVLALSPQVKPPAALVLVTVALAPVMHMLTPSGWFAGEPRYLFPLYSLSHVLLGGLTFSAHREQQRGAAAKRWVMAALIVSAVAVLTATASAS